MLCQHFRNDIDICNLLILQDNQAMSLFVSSYVTLSKSDSIWGEYPPKRGTPYVVMSFLYIKGCFFVT